MNKIQKLLKKLRADKANPKRVKREWRKLFKAVKNK
jgi:hypothetical protein